MSWTSMPVAMNASVKSPRDEETGRGGSSSTVVASVRNLRKDSSTMDVIDRPDRDLADAVRLQPPERPALAGRARTQPRDDQSDDDAVDGSHDHYDAEPDQVGGSVHWRGVGFT